jgi:hypothetical protein
MHLKGKQAAGSGGAKYRKRRNEVVSRGREEGVEVK